MSERIYWRYAPSPLRQPFTPNPNERNDRASLAHWLPLSDPCTLPTTPSPILRPPLAHPSPTPLAFWLSGWPLSDLARTTRANRGGRSPLGWLSRIGRAARLRMMAHVTPASASTYYTTLLTVPYCTHTADVFPHVQYFDSVADLAAKLRNTDLRAVSATMQGRSTLYLPQPLTTITHHSALTTHQ